MRTSWNLGEKGSRKHSRETKRGSFGTVWAGEKRFERTAGEKIEEKFHRRRVLSDRGLRRSWEENFVGGRKNYGKDLDAGGNRSRFLGTASRRDARKAPGRQAASGREQACGKEQGRAEEGGSARSRGRRSFSRRNGFRGAERPGDSDGRPSGSGDRQRTDQVRGGAPGSGKEDGKGRDARRVRPGRLRSLFREGFGGAGGDL